MTITKILEVFNLPFQVLRAASVAMLLRAMFMLHIAQSIMPLCHMSRSLHSQRPRHTPQPFYSQASPALAKASAPRPKTLPAVAVKYLRRHIGSVLRKSVYWLWQVTAQGFVLAAWLYSPGLKASPQGLTILLAASRAKVYKLRSQRYDKRGKIVSIITHHPAPRSQVLQ